MEDRPNLTAADMNAEYQVLLDRAGTRPANHPTRPDIRLLDEDFYQDPHPLFEWMRREAPVYWDEEAGIWGITRYDDVMSVSKDSATFCSGEGSRPDSNVPSMIDSDPPNHMLRRRIVSSGFTPRRVQEHENFLRNKVNELLDAVADRGECDFVREIATPLPMHMIGELMGLPEIDHERLLEWSDLFATGGETVRDKVVPAVGAYADYIRPIIQQRSGNRGTDLISLIANAEIDGQRLSEEDLIFETMLILVGGDETTRHVISGGLEALLHHPAQLDALRQDRSLMSGAIEEMLRWVSPIKNMNRTATRDTEIGGQIIRKGDRMLLLYPSANRDSEKFPNPDQFDIRRHPNEHVAFGGFGRHHCLGAQLARLELSILFDGLLTRFPEISLAEPNRLTPQRRGIFVLGPETLPIRFSPPSFAR